MSIRDQFRASMSIPSNELHLYEKIMHIPIFHWHQEPHMINYSEECQVKIIFSIYIKQYRWAHYMWSRCPYKEI